MKAGLEVASFLSPNYEELYRFMGSQVADVLNVACTFRVGNDLAEFAAEDADLVFACGWWYTRYPEKYEPLAAPVLENPRYGGLPVYYVEMVTASQRPATSLEELYGKVFGFNEENSFSGIQALLAEFDRRNSGLDVFSKVVQTGSHLNSIQALINGEIDCATLDSTVLELELSRQPALEKQLKVAVSLGPYPAPPLLINKQLSSEQREKIADIVLNLPSSELGKYGIREFYEVNQPFYAVLASPNQTI